MGGSRFVSGKRPFGSPSEASEPIGLPSLTVALSLNPLWRRPSASHPLTPSLSLCLACPHPPYTPFLSLGEGPPTEPPDCPCSTALCRGRTEEGKEGGGGAGSLTREKGSLDSGRRRAWHRRARRWWGRKGPGPVPPPTTHLQLPSCSPWSTVTS